MAGTTRLTSSEEHLPPLGLEPTHLYPQRTGSDQQKQHSHLLRTDPCKLHNVFPPPRHEKYQLEYNKDIT